MKGDITVIQQLNKILANELVAISWASVNTKNPSRP
jgi:bacterioferritin (cytochrome b1)